MRGGSHLLKLGGGAVQVETVVYDEVVGVKRLRAGKASTESIGWLIGRHPSLPNYNNLHRKCKPSRVMLSGQDVMYNLIRQGKRDPTVVEAHDWETFTSSLGKTSANYLIE